MTGEFVLALFLVAIGLGLAGSVTHLVQGLTDRPMALRYDGRTAWHMLANLLLSFVCGPYLMLQAGWTHQDRGTMALTSVLMGAFVGLGWAFVSGLFFMSLYVGLVLLF